MFVPTRLAWPSPDRHSSSPTSPSRNNFRRRLASVLVVGGLLAQLGAATTPQAASALPPEPVIGLNSGFGIDGYAGFNGNATNPNPQDLTAAGTTDWRIWGRTTTALGGDDRKSGGTGISDLTDIQGEPAIALRALGPLGLGVGTGPSTVPFAFSWTDGTTNATATATRSGLQHNNVLNNLTSGYGFSFTVPATGSTQQLKVWVSAHHGNGILTATLGDNAPVTNAAVSGGQNYGGVYTVDFTGDGTPGQLLTISYVLQTAVAPGTLDSNGLPSTEANVVVYAAALSGPPPATADAPVLTGIYHVGSDTYYAGHMTANPSTAYDLTFASSASCPGAVLPLPASTFATTTITTPTGSGTFFFRGKLVGSVPAGPNVAVRISGPGGLHSDYSPCVIDGPDNDTWPRAFPLSLSGPPAAQTGAASGYLDVPGRERWYKFTAQPGATVQVSLTGLPADYDLVLFKDIGATYNALITPTTTTDLNKLSAEYASSGFTSSGFTSSGFTSSGFTSSGFTDSVYSSSGFTSSGFTSSGFTSSGFTSSGFTDDAFSSSGFTSSGFTSSGFTSSGFTSSGFTDSVYSSSGFTSSGFTDAFSGAQTRSLVAISSANGTGNEFVSANTWTNSGDYYIRVSGKNGAASLAAPFSLTINQNGGQCDGVGPSVAATTVPSAGAFKTIILTDSSRLPAATLDDQVTLATDLTTFAGRPEVGGVIVDLASDARVQALNDQADAHTSCVYAKNLVADAIRDVVTGYRAQNSSSMQYVVLVGGDEVIPFFRYPDNSDLGPEATYVPPVSSASAAEASLRYNYVLSQDAYGAGIQISLYSSSFPIPDMAVGRLVETASEVSGMLDAYAATSGVVHPGSSLVTGYDFLADAAEAARADLSAGTGTAADTLIAPFNIAPDDPRSWTAAQLKTKLLGARHDVVFLAGHFSANSALAADFKTSVLTTDLASSALDQSNVIVLSIGCHSGYNIPDGAAVPNVTLPLDWAQAFARKGMTGILGTGYQYGDTDFIAYSERIYTGIAHRLRYGTGPVAIGKALVAAKLDYLKATPDIRGLHEKALRIATLYGLPMLGVDLPGGREISDPSDATVGPLTGYPVLAGNPGSELGLKYAPLPIDPTLTPHTVTLRNLDGSPDLLAKYYSGPDGVLTNPGEPAIPLVSVNVDQPLYALRGVGFIDGNYTDEPVVPLNGAPATELKTAHTPFTSSNWFPSMWTPSYYGALSQGGGTRLLVTPAQHRAIHPGEAEVTLRTYSHLGLKLFYSNNLSPGAGSEAPAISEVTAEVSGSSAKFSARVVGDPRAGVQEVWVTYTGLTNAWSSISLEQDPVQSSLWTKTVPLTSGTPTQLDFIVQAVNGFGRVAVSDNAGAYHKVVVGSLTPPSSTSIDLTNPPTSGAYGSLVPVTATLTSTGSTGDKLVVFTLGNATRSAQTDGGVAIVNMPVTSSPGSATLTATFAGDTTSLASATSRSFTVTKIGTTITVTPAAGPISSGANTGIVATLKDDQGHVLPGRNVYFVVTGTSGAWSTTAITDPLGQAQLGGVPLPGGTYSVAAYFIGSFFLEPGHIGLTLTDPIYLPPANASTSLTIKPSQTITFTSAAPTAAVYGDNYTPTATGGGSGNPVTFAGSGACTFAAGKISMTSAGTCTVTANQLGNATYDAAPAVTQVFAVSKKGATLGFTGNLFWSAGSGTSATVTFTGQVTKAAGGVTNVANATVDFLIFPSTNPTTPTPDHCIGTVNSSGVATCTKSLGLDNWTVVMTIPSTNNYFTAPNADAVVLTVYQASAAKYATGAGWVIDPSYRDIPVKVAPTKNHGIFGFAVSYKTGTTPQGVTVYAFRGNNGYDYTFTTSSWTGGGLSFGTGTASFSSKCSVTVINPATRRTVSGLGGTNFTCRYDVKDGTPDTFALSVYTSAGVLYHQVGTVTSPITLGFGSIVVKR